ncbi:hypothetical protein [uncultured Shimia sp.]|uniref:hypothetical protein n=1 Tax=uncultured Shimia sp. TaxID=573152 RepID=UPI0025FEED59|nr:hypothetical protein [uncultured Shimia sp.]
MRSLIRQVTAGFLLALSLVSTPQARAELIAANDDTRSFYLLPLRNGLSALTLVWPMQQVTEERAHAMSAGLLSVITGGTSSRSPHEIHEYLELKGIEQVVTSTRRHLLLTVSAPNEVFPETLVHLENLLLESTYSNDWYQRDLQAVRIEHSTLTRDPGSVLGEIDGFLNYNPSDASSPPSDQTFRFGRPSHAILRSGDEEVEQRVAKLLAKLPRHKVNVRVTMPKWLEIMLGRNRFPFELPTGTIHFQDPSSSEMLILLAKAQMFEDEPQMVGANLLVDYIGANQDSEMFRLLRQEMRASYDPRSHFVTFDKNKAVILFSTTVEADTWPEIYTTLQSIYQTVRTGNVAQARLEMQRKIKLRRFSDNFFHTPDWGADQLLYEYPNGSDGDIFLPIVDAMETASAPDIIASAETFLPPLENYLLILIGGGDAPSPALKSNGYCALPANTPLKHCLEKLSNMGN